MSIKLNRKGAGLAGEDRVKENQNLEMIEQEFNSLDSIKEDSAAAKLSALEALAKADAADSLSRNVQTQLNTIVVEGDSSPQAEQASVGAGGEDYGGNLKARLDAEYNQTATQLAETETLVIEKDVLINNRVDSLVINSGNANAEVSESKTDYIGVSHELLLSRLNADMNYVNGMNNFTTVLIRNSAGSVSTIEERDGEVVVSRTFINRNLNGEVTSTTKAIVGKSTTSTYNKDANGNLTSITKAVV